MKKGTLLMLSSFGLIAIAGWGAWNGLRPPEQDAFHADVIAALSTSDIGSSYEYAVEPRQFEFPTDFGTHPGFQTEWWYYTGNLISEKGQHFGYQLTFFRRALADKQFKGTSKWRTNQIYFAHFAVTDVAQKQFFSFERFSREAIDLAGAQATPYKVWVEDWQVGQENNGYHLQAADKDVEISLNLKTEKPLVLQGDQGLSQKGKGVGNASYYFSQTRLLTQGFIRINAKDFQVSGFSWLDREWSTSALEPGDTGWDWFAIQLDDNREVMLYQIRNAQGASSPYSSGSYIDQSGISTRLSREEFTIKVTANWKSPHTGIVYPSAWLVEIPSHQLALTITPHLKDQEHQHSFVYWEGAVSVTSDSVKGNGYVELTGYQPFK